MLPTRRSRVSALALFSPISTFLVVRLVNQFLVNQYQVRRVAACG
jgi:hypothetical protein